VSTFELTRVADFAALQVWDGIAAAALRADFVALPADPVDDLRPALSGRLNGEDVQLWLAVAAGAPAVSMNIALPVHENRDLAKINLFTHPDCRGRGLARRALEAGLGIARDHGRTYVLFEVPSATCSHDPAPGEAFARSVGARPMLSETRRLLDLSLLSADRLATMQADAAAAAAGYSTVVWGDHTPAEFVSDMAALNALMSTDPPQGELDLEPEVWDSRRYLDREREVIARRRRHLTAAARDERTGELVGFSDLGIPGGGVEVGYQWATVVRSEHRGHGLGMLVKLANLRELTLALPEVRYLNTWNADANRYMVSVNERLGYRPMECWTEWQLDL
jgi:GNAT superfamily N-acetyltransferase